MYPRTRQAPQLPLPGLARERSRTLRFLFSWLGFRRSQPRVLALLWLTLVAFRTQAGAQRSVTLAWNAVTNSSVAGYRVYQGAASRTYTWATNVGNATQITISGLVPGSTYYFACTAYNANNLESDFSSELVYTMTNISLAPVITLAAPADGSVFTLPAAIDLTASATPNGHTITKVQFFVDGTLVNEATEPPYSFALTEVTPGIHRLSAVANYDNDSTVASQNSLVVMVLTANPPSNLAFSADSGEISFPFGLADGVLSQSFLTGLPGGGHAAYGFTISSPGDYMISALVNAPNTGANSFYVNVDAEPTDPVMIWDIPVTMGFTNRTVTWEGLGGASPKIFSLAAGTHQLIIRGREGNTQLQAISILPAYPQLQISSPSDNLILLSGLGLAGHTYEVQASQDLEHWSPLGNVAPDSSGSLSFLDSAAPSFSFRSYRLRDRTDASALLQIQFLPGQGMLLSSVGIPGHSYQVQASEDFINWLVLATVALDSSGSLSFLDSAAPSFSSRSYRLKEITDASALLQIQFLPGQGMLLSGVGIPGHTYQVQASEDFINWLVMATVTPDSSGSLSFLDSATASFPSRSYRLIDTTP